jgi:hypothetical protein
MEQCMGEELEPDGEDVTFDRWLAEHRGGALADELADALYEVVAAVQTTGKNGSVTLKLNVEQKGRQIIVVDKVDAKIPQFDREAAIYWADGEGRLFREDPAQQKMQFEEVHRDGAIAGLAVVDRDTGELHEVPPRDKVEGDAGE